MQHFYFLRHGITAWNQQKRIQGRTDIPLCDQGIELLEARTSRLTPVCDTLHWYSSPLLRATQTAALLQLTARPDPALIEMNWGEWEGHTLNELRQAAPEEMAREEVRGLLMTPAGGESPAQVLQRINRWASTINHPAGTGCVTHKGVIRAVYAAAAGWDMQTKPRHKLDYSCLQHFGFEQGRWSVLELNLPLTRP